MVNATNFNSLEGIAIIGMAGRFPGAKSIEEFWQNLHDGVESISVFTDEELISSGINPDVLSDPNYVKVGGVLEDIDLFDASFFGFNHREAEITDPQHRLFLECAWEALENAGYDSTRCERRIGVYAGAGLNNYLSFDITRDRIGSASCYQTLIGNDKDFLTTRVSYKLNLKGPSVTLQTACSTSLVATTLACQSLLNYQCDMALVGGVSVRVPQKVGYLYQEEGVLSPDGHCHAFDAKGRGTVLGNGVGVVVLKRLTDAIADRDCIHAVIKGSAINNDGSGKVGYTAPSVDGQAEVIAEALALAGIDPETVSYIEAHGTGTSLGDPIEIAALTKVFRANTQKRNFCAIGSVKTNVGHLDTAAGVTSLIKTVLALKHKQIPPSLHFEEPNSRIDFANSPFYVNTTLSEWKTNGTPRRAGVSSFGIGGTNAHVILEEAPDVETRDFASGDSRPWQLLMLSAKTSSALETATANLANYLQQHPDLNLADVAYTLQVGRQAFDYRRAVVCSLIEDAVNALQDPKRVLTSIREIQERPVAFMFSGLGSHYVNMGWELYQAEPTFKEHVDYCCELLKPRLNLDLRDVLYPKKNHADTGNKKHNTPSAGLDLRKMLGRGEEQANVETSHATSLLNQTFFTQPAIFVIEYALAQLWMSWGIRPAAMIGYSIGEYVAATLAGVLSVEEALTLVTKRAQMIQELPGGAMVAVPLSEKKLQPFLNEKLSLSAVNGSSLCVVAGFTDAVEELEKQLSERGLVCRRLQTTHAFHSKMMEVIAPVFHDLVKTFNLKPPKIPYLSNVTGTWITAAEATDPSYWVKHLCQAVRFASGVQELSKKDNPILLEVGPGQTLSSLALQCIESEQGVQQIVLPSLRDSYDQQTDLAFLLNTLGRLTLAGIQIDWSGFYAHEHRHRIPLPTYPFKRQRYWIEPQKNTRDGNLNQATLEQKLDIRDWFYIPSWKRSLLPITFETGRLTVKKQCWLVFVDQCAIGTQIVEKLQRENQNVITVKIGEQFCQSSEWEYTINPQNRDDYNALLKAIRELGKIPTIIAHLWNITPNDLIRSKLECFEKAQDIGFYSLLFLAQALGEQNITGSIQIGVVSNNMQQLLDEEGLCPEKATVIGPCRVISQEYSNIICRSIDITLPQSGTKQWQQLIDQLLAELAALTSDPVIAYRGNQRWVQYFETLPIESSTVPIARLREKGVYIITGGLGEIGLVIAEYLAKAVRAKIVLIGRKGLPPKVEWEQWLSSHQEEDLLSRKIKKVLRLEELGAEVLILTADVANFEQMQEAVNQVRACFNEIHGVIHAAGVPGEGLIQFKTSELATKVLEPKLKGTLVLDAVFKDVNLDFLVLFSSNTAITGGVGKVDYCAASAFLDAFAHYNFSTGKMHTVSINWDWWLGNDWADKMMSVIPEIQEQFNQVLEKYGIRCEEGIDVFSRILSTKLPQVVVSTQNLQTVIDQFKIFAGRLSLEKLEKSHQRATTHPRPILGIAYVAPNNELEQKIANIWQELLGIEQLGINDNFFNLGGHSLLATQLVSQLRKDFQVELSLRHIFGAPTIAELALIIEEMILGELEELTEDETKELVSIIPNQKLPQNISQRRYMLPNNLEVVYQTKAEADYFYEDIFKNQVYLKHGITLRDRACIFDVGANIGMFTLFVNQKCQNPTIYAFEPVPTLFEILRLNTNLHEVNVKLFNVGISNETKTATFTFYPNSSGMSSFYGDKEEEKEVLQAIMTNQLQSGMTGMEQVMEYADELLEERLKAQTLTCQLRTLSEVIKENNVECIDLLKIDVQKSELDVLQGIKNHDWKKIQQIVIEVHNTEGRLEHITNLLRMQGYHVVAEQENLYEGSAIHNVYAVRK
ncbi:MAG: FkbM family methyltransferase [Scytonema sp. PMC 1069.18]|nr:FkbM family methyltransferase [Scytonema sp. PMC 1069.18]MEC4880337.1 FkbM family methyltransferase [Scytonema sp. PMC 1070.18]